MHVCVCACVGFCYWTGYRDIPNPITHSISAYGDPLFIPPRHWYGTGAMLTREGGVV